MANAGTFAATRAVPHGSHTLSSASVPCASSRLPGELQVSPNPAMDVMTQCTLYAHAHRRPHGPHGPAASEAHRTMAKPVPWGPMNRARMYLRIQRCMLPVPAPHSPAKGRRTVESVGIRM